MRSAVRFVLTFLLSVTPMTNAFPADVRTDSNSGSTVRHGPRIRNYDVRPFKAIIVTSKPFGLDKNKPDNVIEKNPTTPATPTSTLGYQIASPTIPFFSISCSVGSSCSQIISARKVPTPKPTFKPYTKEDREKFKLAYSQVFGPTALLTASLGAEEKRKPSPATSPVKTSTTTTTTARPASSTGFWRVRTTTHKPAIGTVISPTSQSTKNKPTLASTIKDFAINTAIESVSKWKWPNNDAISRPQSEKHSATTNNNNNRNTVVVHSSIKLATTPAPLSSALNNHEQIKTGTFSPASHGGSQQSARPGNQENNNNRNSQTVTKWLSALLAASINNAVAQRKTVPHQSTQVNHHKHYYNPEHNEIKPPQKTMEPVKNEPEKQQYLPFIGKEVINTKGDKTTIITGSSVRQHQNNQHKLANQNAIKLPPEVFVSSHGIRLQVAPKTRAGSARFVQNYQGVQIETDGEDVNLSELIMNHYPVVQPKRD